MSILYYYVSYYTGYTQLLPSFLAVCTFPKTQKPDCDLYERGLHRRKNNRREHHAVSNFSLCPVKIYTLIAN